MAMIPCPNGGRCGSHNHRVGSEAYGRCVQIATGDSYKSPFVRLTNTPRNVGSDNGITLGGMTKTLKSFGTYVQADSPIFSEVSLNSRQVQDYIDNPESVSFNDKQESLINEGIRRNIEDIAGSAGIDIDELSPEEVDIVCQAARKAMGRTDALNCVAEKMGPRTFSCDCTGNSPRAAEIFDRRYSTYYDGSKEWYSAMARAYLDDIIEEGWNYDRGDEAAMEADRQAIASALKQAIGYDLNEIDDDYYDELPGIEVVWTGDLSDVGPNDDSGLQEKLHIWQPHFIFSHPTGEVVSDPVRLHGQYVIDLPSREDRCNGAESRILDDMSSRRTRRFDYPDGVGLSQYSAADVYRTFE